MNIEDYPLLKMEDIAPTLEIFQMKLIQHNLPIPCALQIGQSTIRIHSGDHLSTMNLGIRLLIEAREHFAPND